MSYVVKGRCRKYCSDESEDVYMAYDANSGGYPYWSNTLYGIKYFDDLEKAETSLVRDMKFLEQATRIEICRVDYVIVKEIK